MKKILNSSDAPVVLGSTSTDDQLFPPGFRYRMGSLIYTVRRDCTQEASSPMREVFLSDGATEIIPVETLIKDMKEITGSSNAANGEIMDPDERFVPKQAVIKKVAKNKTAKKKVAKKKAKKKKTKNG
jgi:hypothetical protein